MRAAATDTALSQPRAFSPNASVLSNAELATVLEMMAVKCCYPLHHFNPLDKLKYFEMSPSSELP